MSSTPPLPEQFLSDIDRNPSRAMDGFYRFAVRQLLAMPPGPMRGLAREQQEDLIQEIALHCVAQDFRVLRQFDARRGDFAGWFHLVARNRAYDWLRAQGANPPISVDPAELDRRDPAPSAERNAWAAQMLSAVNEALESLSDDCRVLLGGAANGLRPSELAMLLGWGREKNKKASDDLRACRARLRKWLEDHGYDLEEIEDLK